jgi:hypothetical protein
MGYNRAVGPQLIHELKEGLDISTEMRREFVRNVETALRGVRAPAAARTDLRLVLRTYDATVHAVLQVLLPLLSSLLSFLHLLALALRSTIQLDKVSTSTLLETISNRQHPLGC